MKVDKVVTVQVEDISVVEVEVTLLKHVADKLLFIGFLGGLVDGKVALLGHKVVWDSAQKKSCLA